MKYKLKWSYDSKLKQWYITESRPYANDGMSIKKEGGEYNLEMSGRSFGYFKKVSSAKQVAYLINYG